MRFLQIVMSKVARSGPPDPGHVAKVRKANEDDIASGRLVAMGALAKRDVAAARVTSKAGEITVEDPPAGDGWMAGGGYSLIDVPSKEAAILRARRTLEVMGDGVVELIQVTEMHPPPKVPGVVQPVSDARTKISVRLATEGDVEALAELNQQVQELHAAQRPLFFKKVDVGALADSLRSTLRSEDAQMWIAEVDGTLVGYALTIIRRREENLFTAARHFCELDRIGVSPPFRRRGVARALVERALSEMRSRGIEEVELVSWSFNVDAHRAFAALGFAPMHVRFERTKS